MHLINVNTLELQHFVSDPPPYVILSHTWGDEEVTFAYFTSSDSKSQKAGYQKIKFTCDQAKKHNIDYAWVDTCCINKDSSAELSEAINSMYQWYSNAKYCYAFIEDARLPEDRSAVNDSSSLLEGCKWFTRGWTLQELLAPQEVIFFGPNWSEIGRKTEMCDALYSITGIPQEVLRKEKPFEDVSVAARMSWAAERQTTRKEDVAYCLLGIFDVNMPLLYGEGNKAFVRLQEQIMNQLQDDTLFAWCSDTESASQFPYRGLLASSPRDFRGCVDLMPFSEDDAGTTHLIGNGKVSLRCTYEEQDGLVLGLQCCGGDLSKRKGIEVIKVGLGSYIRQNPFRLTDCSSQVLENVVIDKYALKRGISQPDNIHRRDAVHLDQIPEGVHVRAIHHPSKIFDPSKRTVSVMDILHQKVAFELELDKNAFDLLLSIVGLWKNPRFLIVLWVEQNPGMRSFSYYYDMIHISLDAHEHFAKSTKPQRVHNRRELRISRKEVYSSTSHRQIQGYPTFVVDLRLYSSLSLLLHEIGLFHWIRFLMLASITMAVMVKLSISLGITESNPKAAIGHFFSLFSLMMAILSILSATASHNIDRRHNEWETNLELLRRKAVSFESFRSIGGATIDEVACSYFPALGIVYGLLENNNGSDGGGSIQGDEQSYDSHNWDYTEPNFAEEYTRSNRYSWENRSDNIPWCPRELIEHMGEKPATSSSGKTETARKEGHTKGTKGKRGKDYSSKS